MKSKCNSKQQCSFINRAKYIFQYFDHYIQKRVFLQRQGLWTKISTDNLLLFLTVNSFVIRYECHVYES